MKIELFFFLSLCLAFTLVQTISAQAKADKVDEFVREQMRNLKIPGLAMAVLEDGKVVKMSAYGSADLETGTPVTPKSVFTIASLSKQFIAMAVLLLEQEGKLSLDDKAAKYIDGSPEAWKDITLRQLLAHTSGIVRDPADYLPYKEQPPMDVIRAMFAVPLNAPPGEKWLYSNAGYYILAVAIGKACGEPWDKFIAERLFTPAGMTNTRTYTVTEIVPNRVSGYHNTADGRINAERWIAVRPSSAFLSTIEDLAKWDEFLDKRNPLSKANRELMWTPATLNDKTASNYALGWYVEPYFDRTRVHHDGQYPGFRSVHERFPKDRLSVIVLANSDNARLNTLAIKVAGFYKSDLLTPPFSFTVKLSADAVPVGTPVNISVAARDDGRAAPKTILEMEIFDASGRGVHKQNKTDTDFAEGETEIYNFTWTPTKAGQFTVNVGTYGPRWVPNYAWKENLAVIKVN